MTLLYSVPRPASCMLDKELASAGQQEFLLSYTEVLVTVPCMLPVAAHRLNTLPVIIPPLKLHGLPLFISNYAAKIFYFFHKQVEICSFLELLNFTIQNMYDSPDCGMIYMTPQTFGLWKLFALPSTVSASLRERVIPLLQSREI